jgi:hypothetical protein
MTNNEYILKTLGLFGITQETVDVILVDSTLAGDAMLDVARCQGAIYKDFHLVRAAAHRNVSEGGFSMSWNDCEKALKDFERSLADELGATEDGKSGYGCVDKSYIW